MTNPVNNLASSIIRSIKKVFILLLILPLLSIIIFLLFIEININNLFFIFCFLTAYFLSLILLIIIYTKAIPSRIRSPLKFIERLNTTHNEDDWDKYQQPLKHLLGVEIGVYKGANAKNILDYLNIKQLVLVDPWQGEIDIKTGIMQNQLFYENLYNEVKNKFSNNPKVQIIREFSINAAKMFDDEKFDFIYIDGDHRYQEVLKDLEAWYPKLRYAGVMCGDDYGHPSGIGVIKAVTEFSFKHKLIIHYGEDNQFWFVKV